MRALFGVTIPIFRIACSAIFIYAGICILVGPVPANDNERKTFLFEKINATATKTHRTYNSLFSQTTIDLTALPISTKKRTLEINNIFGTTDILLNSEIPTLVVFERAFASIRAPEQELPETTSTLPVPFSLLFGTFSYRNYPSDIEPLVEIKSRAVFGTVVIYNNPLAAPITIGESLPSLELINTVTSTVIQ